MSWLPHFGKLAGNLMLGFGEEVQGMRLTIPAGWEGFDWIVFGKVGEVWLPALGLKENAPEQLGVALSETNRRFGEVHELGKKLYNVMTERHEEFQSQITGLEGMIVAVATSSQERDE